MTLSGDKKYLVNGQTNKPVFITGDAPQTLSTMLSDADVDIYLADRQSRGFNAIWVILVDQVDQTNAPHDFYGNVPFDGAWFTNENAAYWAHQDHVIQQAAARGITVFAEVTFVGLTASNGNDFTAIQNSSNSVMAAYGTWLGNRYKNYNNVVWMVGGDADPFYTDVYSKLSSLATALAAADPNHLITFEASRFTQSSGGGTAPGGGYSSLDVWPNAPSWLGLNWVYQSNAQLSGVSSVVSGCRSNYARSPWLPPLMGEDWYELEHSMTGAQVRTEGYWEVLSGCYLGRLFGNDSIWTFNGPQVNNSGPSWQSQLASEGSVGEQYLGKLMRSREHWKMVPDVHNTILTAGFGSGTTLSVASRTADGQTVIAYIPNGNATTVSIEMGAIVDVGSQAKCWWYDPQTAATTLIGTFPNSGIKNFTPPNGNDWVLVIDSVAAGLAAPGTTEE